MYGLVSFWNRSLQKWQYILTAHLWGYRYVLTFIDAVTECFWSFPLVNRDESSVLLLYIYYIIIIYYISYIYYHTMYRFHTNGGKELFSLQQCIIIIKK